MIQCVSALCVLGIVILGLLMMTGVVSRAQALAAAGRAVAVIILAWVALCIARAAVGAVLPLLRHVMAWMAIVAFVIGVALLVRTVSLLKRFVGIKKEGGKYE